MTPRMHSTESELVRRWIETPIPRPLSRPALSRAAPQRGHGADAVDAFDWEDLVDRSDRRRQALAHELELGSGFDGLAGVPAAPGGGRRAFHR